MRFMSAPGFTVDLSACLVSGALVVSGSGSWTSSVGVSGSLTVRERPPFWSIQPKYSSHLRLSGLRRRRNAGESISSGVFFAVCVSVTGCRGIRTANEDAYFQTDFTENTALVQHIT